jgi:hypothetical protein
MTWITFLSSDTDTQESIALCAGSQAWQTFRAYTRNNCLLLWRIIWDIGSIIITMENRSTWRKKKSQCHLVGYRFHIDGPGTELSLRSERLATTHQQFWSRGTLCLTLSQGRRQHGEKVGYCYPNGLEKTPCKWYMYTVCLKSKCTDFPMDELEM